MGGNGLGRERRGGLLAILAALVIALALLAAYLSSAVYSSDGFADRATAALDNGAVRDQIAERLTDDVAINSGSDLLAVRPVVRSAVAGLIGGGPFQSLFRAGVRDLHRAVFDRDLNTVTLTLADAGSAVRGTLQALAPAVAKKIPRNANLPIEKFEPPAAVAGFVRLGDRIGFLKFALFAVGLGFLGLALWVSENRRRIVLRFAVSAVLTGILLAVAVGVIGSLLAARLDQPEAREAVRAVYDAFTGDLATLFYAYAAAGVVLAAAASALVGPVDVTAPARQVGELLQVVPESVPLRALRALGLVALGILIVVEHDAVLNVVIILVGLYVAYAGVLELLRLTLPDESASATTRASGRRALAASVIAGVIIIAGGAALSASGKLDEVRAEEPAVGCNGSRAFCDLPIDDLAVPATHNSMSAASDPNWLFPQQESGIASQLQDGIRGLLIDAYYGTPTRSGRVATDLSTGEKGEAARAAVGPAAFAAAKRIRHRIVSSPAGPRGVYLCHGFCEPGALPIDTAFGEIRDFLAANPRQLLFVVVEDYVPPRAIADAVKRTGLLEHVYRGPLNPGPALGSVVPGQSRVVMMAENKPGGASIPWYHSAYKKLVQETPFSFKRPAQLVQPKQLPASCQENRGQPGAPYFLINHWIDTSPAPRPSNAREVNARRVLLARVRRCQKLREHDAGLIAVDFYKEGDVVGVTDKLNKARAARLEVNSR